MPMAGTDGGAMDIKQNIAYLVVVTTCVYFLLYAGPALVALADTLAPFVIAVGLVVGGLRLAWYYTNRDQ